MLGYFGFCLLCYLSRGCCFVEYDFMYSFRFGVEGVLVVLDGFVDIGGGLFVDNCAGFLSGVFAD